jgi:hypothetical protein
VSSNSCGPDAPARALLAGALAALERESPWHARALAAALADRACVLAVGAERLRLAAHAGVAAVTDAAGDDAPLRVEVSLATALLLLDAERDVLDCLGDRSLRVFGDVGTVLAFTRVAEILLHGLVRCASSRALLDSLRGEVARGRGATPPPEPLDDAAPPEESTRVQQLPPLERRGHLR